MTAKKWRLAYMKQLYNKKYRNLYLLLIIMVAQAKASSTATIFDPLLPQTPFKKVIMRCMNVRSTAHMIMDHEGPACDAELLYDSMIGRIIQLALAVDTIVTRSTQYCHADIEYLCTIVEYMIAEIDHALCKHTDEQKIMVTPLITAIKNKLENALDYT